MTIAVVICMITAWRNYRVLEPGMVITVEPGCYFNPSLLKPALEDSAQAPFLVKDRILSMLVRSHAIVVLSKTTAEACMAFL